MIFSSSTNDLIKDGDTVIFFVSPNDIHPVLVANGSILQHRLGKFRHADFIDKRFGSKVSSVDGQKHVSVLRPTAELWTRSLPHRTQILYLPDISFILRKLNIVPGCVVVESGTGSGSFSHAISRAIFPSGHLYTFEFHPERAAMAKDEFKRHVLADVVTSHHRDVIENGFELSDLADAVFLDLPATWDAIAHARTAMKKDGSARICCFSPCIEQVLKNFEAFRKEGFVDIQMFEVLSRDYEVRIINESGAIDQQSSKKRTLELESATGKPDFTVRPSEETKGHTSYLTFARLPNTLNLE
jgi:tRNA (adenine57-N1/adenine58-N1)-methyltransferase